jgi:predicted Fe-S protein YdhL (DUF1289 family)
VEFRPCRGRDACVDDDAGCRTCGRSHEEIIAVRKLTDDIGAFIERMDYENFEEFLDYVARKVAKKLRAARKIDMPENLK